MSEHDRQAVSIGFDGDGHKRVTTIDKDQTVVGGSAETHDKLVEVNMKLREKLKKDGKNLQNAEPDRIKDHLNDITSNMGGS